MAESPDYKELLQLLNDFDVEYLIAGGFASDEVRRAALHARTRCMGAQFSRKLDAAD